MDIIFKEARFDTTSTDRSFIASQDKFDTSIISPTIHGNEDSPNGLLSIAQINPQYTADNLNSSTLDNDDSNLGNNDTTLPELEVEPSVNFAKTSAFYALLFCSIGSIKFYYFATLILTMGYAKIARKDCSIIDGQ